MAFGAFIQNISELPVSNGAGGRRIRITFKPGYANYMSGVIKVQALNGRGQAAALGIGIASGLMVAPLIRPPALALVRHPLGPQRSLPRLRRRSDFAGDQYRRLYFQSGYPPRIYRCRLL